MFRIPQQIGGVFFVLFTLLAGCSLDSVPLKATWVYTELTKDDSGHVKEVGDKHTLRSGSDEMYPIHGKRLETVTVTSAKVKFRLSGDDSAEMKEVELQSGNGQDLWLGGFGVRLHVEKIGPL